jgi:hypothetical protein
LSLTVAENILALFRSQNILRKIPVTLFMVIWQNLSNHGLTRFKKIRLDIYRQTVQLVIFLPTFNALCMRQRFNVTGTVQNFFGYFWPSKQGLYHIFCQPKQSIP